MPAVTEEIVKIYRRSDFDIIIDAYHMAGPLDAKALGETEFSGILWSGADRHANVRFSHRDGKWDNCRLMDDGRIRVIAQNHILPVGRLSVEITVYTEDPAFGDGVRRSVCRHQLGVELVNEEGEYPVEGELCVTLPYIYRDAYDTAVAGGYEGTREEFENDMVTIVTMRDKLTEVAELRATIAMLRDRLEALEGRKPCDCDSHDHMAEGQLTIWDVTKLSGSSHTLPTALAYLESNRELWETRLHEGVFITFRNQYGKWETWQCQDGDAYDTDSWMQLGNPVPDISDLVHISAISVVLNSDNDNTSEVQINAPDNVQWQVEAHDTKPQ